MPSISRKKTWTRTFCWRATALTLWKSIWWCRWTLIKLQKWGDLLSFSWLEYCREFKYNRSAAAFICNLLVVSSAMKMFISTLRLCTTLSFYWQLHVPTLNHVGLWVDDLPSAVDWLTNQGMRFTPGGIRKGARKYVAIEERKSTIRDWKIDWRRKRKKEKEL